LRYSFTPLLKIALRVTIVACFNVSTEYWGTKSDFQEPDLKKREDVKTP
jgi:hypothetical protein